MPLDQRQKISPPTSNDINSLKDFASVIQYALDELFEEGHNHTVKTSAPTDSDGSVGDIWVVELSGVGYLYVKLPTLGWKRVALS